MADTKKRNLVKALAASGGVTAIVDRWFKPVVNGVTLPAHAQATVALVCTGSPPVGTNINLGDPVTATLQVTPAPMLPASASAQYFCGPTSDPPFDVPLDINGRASVDTGPNSQNLACAGADFEVVWTFDGQTAICSWPVAAG